MAQTNYMSGQDELNFSTTQFLHELAALHQAKVHGLESNVASLNDSEYDRVIIKRPWIDEPAGSVPLDTQNGITIGVVGAGDEVVLSYTVPDGYDGVIKGINNNVNFGGFVQFSGDIIWRILANKRPIRGFEAISNERGTIAIQRPISPIRIYSGQIIEYIVSHVANAALAGQIICGFSGYTYPSKSVS